MPTSVRTYFVRTACVQEWQTPTQAKLLCAQPIWTCMNTFKL